MAKTINEVHRAICPTCGSDCLKSSGGETNFFKPIQQDSLLMALKELVRLKNLSDYIKDGHGSPGEIQDYLDNKPIAWATARELIVKYLS